MRIGFVTRYSQERAEFAGGAGFDGLEIAVGGALPAKSEVRRIKETMASNGLATLTVFHGENYAAADAAAARKARSNFGKVCGIARELGTKIVTLNAWVPRDASLTNKFAHYKRTFGELAKVARDKGCVIAIENCPHGFCNIAWSPANWERMFDELPTKAIGLEFDPSHLVWQGIDYVSALRRFADRVYAFHAKDTEIMGDVLGYVGISGPGWWRFRIPGHGDINWKRLFTVLDDINYSRDVIIEHEDPVFSGDRCDDGLRLGLKFLRQFVV
ncbi:MAG: sugar phosphate isomerase/epimerase [Armatimonadota bacterium]|nr:MAG: sugar phosphate isomerase/epimerase [Armatimonadota bacterium]